MNRYLVEYVPGRALEAMKATQAPFTKEDIRSVCSKHDVLFTKEVEAMTADDAVTIIRYSEGDGIRGAIVLAISAVGQR